MKKHTSTLTIPVNHSHSNGGNNGSVEIPNHSGQTNVNTFRSSTNNHDKTNIHEARPIKDDILSAEIDRMNHKMRELQKSFEDLTTTNTTTAEGVGKLNKSFSGGNATHINNNSVNHQPIDPYFSSSRVRNNDGAEPIPVKYSNHSPHLDDHRGGAQKGFYSNNVGSRGYVSATMPRRVLTDNFSHNNNAGGNGSNGTTSMFRKHEAPNDDFDREVESFRQNFEDFKRSTASGINYPSGVGPHTPVTSPKLTTMYSGGGGVDHQIPPVMIGGEGSNLNESHVIKETPAGQKLYTVTLDMKEFKPQDIKVKIVDGKLLRVEARVEGKTETGGSIQKEFNREFTIPANVNTDALVSRIDSRGIMSLEAPVIVDNKFERLGAGKPGGDANKYSSSSSRSFNATSNEFFDSPNALRRFDMDKMGWEGPASASLPRRKYSWTGGGNTTDPGFKAHRVNGPPPDFFDSPQPWGTSTFKSKLLGGDPGGRNLLDRDGTATLLRTTPLHAPKEPFKLNFDLNGFSADEIKINVCDNAILKVHAKHESKSPNGTVSRREFNREYTLPSHVNPDAITSSLSKDGVLTIESIDRPGQSFERPHYGPEGSRTVPSRPFETFSTYQTNGPSSSPPENKNVKRYTTDHLPSKPGVSSAVPSDSNNNIHGIESSRTSNACRTGNFKLTFDMKDYEPEDIKVKVLGDSLRIEAKHIENSPSKGNIIREFSREYIIPQGVDHSQLRSSLSNSGLLTIEAPVNTPTQSNVL